jgi:hypothetical protein
LLRPHGFPQRWGLPLRDLQVTFALDQGRHRCIALHVFATMDMSRRKLLFACLSCSSAALRIFTDAQTISKCLPSVGWCPRSSLALATEDGQLMAERDDLKLKLRAAAEPACDRGRERRQKGVHARDATAAKQKTPVFSPLSEFSAGTGSHMRVPLGQRPRRIRSCDTRGIA